MWALALIGLALGILGPISKAFMKDSRVEEAIRRTREAIKKSQSLKQRLSDAFYSNDTSLANDLMNTTPLGAAYKTVKLERQLKNKINTAVQDALDKKIANAESDLDKLENSQYTDDFVTNVIKKGEQLIGKGDVDPFTGQLRNPSDKKTYSNKKFKYQDLQGHTKESDTDTLLKWGYGIKDKNPLGLSPKIEKYQQNTTNIIGEKHEKK